MGKRGRAQGLVPTSRDRAMHRARKDQRDQRAKNIAHMVGFAAADFIAEGIEPVEVQAPLAVAAEMAAPQIVQIHGLPTDVETGEAVKRYLLAGFRNMTLGFDAQHFEEWRRSAGVPNIIDPG